VERNKQLKGVNSYKVNYVTRATWVGDYSPLKENHVLVDLERN